MESIILDSLVKAIPFANHNGIRVVEAKPEVGRTTLIQHHEIESHMNSVHAAALFGLAETSAASLISALFFEQLDHLKIVAKKGEIDFVKIAKGHIESKAVLEESREAILVSLRDMRNVVFSTRVDLTDCTSHGVATARFEFSVKQTQSNL